MLKYACTIVGLYLPAVMAQAVIVDLGSVTQDTATGLEWLDVTETRNWSYNDVAAEFGPGGNFEGWRFATAEEFDQLIVNFGYVRQNTDCAYGVQHCDVMMPGDNPIIETIIRTLGDTLNAFYDETNNDVDIFSDGAGYTFGVLSNNVTNPLNTSHATAAVIDDSEFSLRETGAFIFDNFDYVETALGVLNRNSSSPLWGSYLVRPGPVVSDTDVDGIIDELDNCTLVSNSDQRDTDGDGFGNVCDPDLNNDGVVNVVDLGMLRAVFFTSDENADFDGSGSVNVIDLGILRSYFFAAPGPGVGTPVIGQEQQ